MTRPGAAHSSRTDLADSVPLPPIGKESARSETTGKESLMRMRVLAVVALVAILALPALATPEQDEAFVDGGRGIDPAAGGVAPQRLAVSGMQGMDRAFFWCAYENPLSGHDRLGELFSQAGFPSPVERRGNRCRC